ncbi:unnamed protein product [Closterium sp. Yama58-4]|nr:unnamed protein product [Closterium sp. Yama58-4]
MSSRRSALRRLTTACHRLLASPPHALPSLAARSAIRSPPSPSPAFPHDHRLIARDLSRLHSSARTQPSLLPPFPPHTRNLSPRTSAAPDHALLPPPPHSLCALPAGPKLLLSLRQCSASAQPTSDSNSPSRDSERGRSRGDLETKADAAKNRRAEHRRAAEDWREETRRAEEWIRYSGEPPPARDTAHSASAGTSHRVDQRARPHSPRDGRGSGERRDWGERTSSGGRSDWGERSDRGGRSRSGGREQQQHHLKAEAARRAVRHKRILEEEESPSFEKWLQRQGGGSAAREGGGGKQWREKKVRWVAGTYAEMRASHGMRLLNAQRSWMESEDVAMVARHLMHMDGHEEYDGHECALRVLKWGHSMGIYSPSTSPREAMLLAHHLASRQRVADMLTLTHMVLAARPPPPVFAEEMLAVLAACVRHKRAAEAAAVYSFVRGVGREEGGGGGGRGRGVRGGVDGGRGGGGSTQRGGAEGGEVRGEERGRGEEVVIPRKLLQKLYECLQQPEHAGVHAQVKAHVEKELRLHVE